jgi:hypothetical protein
MEPQMNESESVIAPLKKVTPLSKYLAMTLFIILPFLGGWIGYQAAIEKEKIQNTQSDQMQEIPEENAPLLSESPTDVRGEKYSESDDTKTIERISLYSKYFKLNFQTDSTDTISDDKGPLIIRPFELPTPINLTGWTVESDSLKTKYVIGTVQKDGNKWKETEIIEAVNIVLYPNQSDDIMLVSGGVENDSFRYSGEGGSSYRLYSGVPIWNTVHDTITIRDATGAVVQSITF